MKLEKYCFSRETWSCPTPSSPLPNLPLVPLTLPQTLGKGGQDRGWKALPLKTKFLNSVPPAASVLHIKQACSLSPTWAVYLTLQWKNLTMLLQQRNKCYMKYSPAPRQATGDFSPHCHRSQKAKALFWNINCLACAELQATFFPKISVAVSHPNACACKVSI